MIHSDCGGTGVVSVPGGAMTCIPCGGTGQVETDFVRRPYAEGLDCPEPEGRLTIDNGGYFIRPDGQRHQGLIHPVDWPRL